MDISHYRLTPDAQADLIEIRRFTVQQWGEVQSEKYLSGLQQTFRLLASTPALGRDRPDVGSGVLSFPYVSHVIYYLIHERQPVIFGVLHKRMVPANHLDGREMI
ncbi:MULTISPECIES: type II toxin-antitoxin system RelE/ParE family toxin [Photorhabdus]|uniref:Toxin n=1 Tax=Photorhabdus temperata J3 TaxID=1389415 RepID=U7R6J1_PHOTE|nr:MULTISPECIES: type II toxin-antitoxin system RelE/ParE family toxin [Photorhabdus]ERT14381.1 plasmid stabilization protein [Photorhabdus temperata J3]